MNDLPPSLRDSGPDSPADRVAARLAEVRKHLRTLGEAQAEWPFEPHDEEACECANDIPRLLAAAGKVLELAGEMDAEDGYDCSDGERLGRPVSRGDRIREAISRALLGEGETGG